MCIIKNLRWFNILILLAFVFAPLSSAASTKASAPLVAPGLEFAPDRLLARLQDGFTLEGDHLQSLGVQSAQALFRGQSLPSALAQVVRLELIPGSDVKSMAESLSQDSRFVWVEPDYLAYPSSSSSPLPRGEGSGVRVDVTPNDPLYPDQWGLAKIEAPAAWDVETGSETVVIAIVDSGIQRTHPDLQARMWVNPGEVAGNGVDDDNNGLIDDVHGWDFVSEDNDPIDDNGHGTQVAGAAVASTNNSTGIAGTCWGCRLMAVKVMSAGGVANYSDIAQGVLYAAQKGAKVINLSLGGYSFSNTLKEAVQSAVNEYGAVVVAGAGNDNTSNPFYPAAYDEAIAVAGTDQNDLKASFSDYGAWVDLSAPSVAIHTTYSGGDYGPVDGTSMAAPFVSGLAGLLLSEHPDWSGSLIRLQMTHTTDPIDALNPGYEGLLGSGRINAANALTVTPHPLFEILEKKVNGDPLGRPTPGESATLEITLANDWLDAQSVQGVLSTSDPYVTVTQDTAQFGDLPAGGSGVGSPLFEFDVASGAGYDHLINFTVALSAYGGYSSTLNFTIKTRSAQEQVWGTIGVDTTWTNDKTYIVMGNVGVAPGITLTVEAGTDVLFNGNYSLNVGGQLIADGTEDQPIRFLSNTESDWGRIYFDDTSIDATADLSGTYQGGNILRWVMVEGASSGIGCNSATPYLGHVTADGGEMNCTTGSTPFWLSNSVLSGGVNVAAGPDTPEPNGRWRPRADMPTGRYQLGVVAASNGKIYAIGGWGESGFLAIVEEYDPATDTWTTRASMPAARFALGVAAASNGKIYAIGGYNGSYLTTVEEYDPATDTWTTRASMPTARSYLGVAAASNGKIYAIGGYDDLSPLATVEEYDPATDTWMTRANMPTARYGLGVATASNGKIYAIGGSDLTSLFATVEEYDPATNTWTTRASMPTARAFLGVAAASNGKIYAIGGVVNGGMFIATVEEYDPATNTWTTRTSMPTARSDLGITAASSGRIYAIGGYGSGSGLMVVEEFALPSEGALYHMLAVQVSGGNVSMPNWAEVLSNTITSGGITIGSGQVLSNTLSGGAISAGDSSIIQGNNIENSPAWGIQSSGTVTITQNRLVGNTMGIQAYGGPIQGNLVANGAGVGLEINGDVSVSNNTFTNNAGNTVVIQSGTPIIQGNNLEGNTGTYDIQNLTANDIPAQDNWWGTTEAFAISQRIYDYDDDYTLGEVVYQPFASGPVQTAPAYVRSVTVDPNPVGIETATFEVEFSRPMETELITALSFQTVLNNSWSVYDTSNSGLPNQTVFTIATDPNDSHWFGTGDGATYFDGDNWTVYNTSNSGLPGDYVYALTSDANDSHWFGTWDGGVAHYDGINWTVYNTSNSGLPDDRVISIATDMDGSHWFGTLSGVTHFNGAAWVVYNASNSELPENNVDDIVIDGFGNKWFSTGGGVARFDGTNWTLYNESNSCLPTNEVNAIAIDTDATMWFGTGGGVVHIDGITCTVYNTNNSGLPDNGIYDIAVDIDGSKWFGTYGNSVAKFDGTNWVVYNTNNSGLPGNGIYKVLIDSDGTKWFGTLDGGVGVLWVGYNHTINTASQWPDSSHYSSVYDITSLVTRGDYRITVAGAIGTDGMQIAPNTATTFTVDYAGGVGDTTPPPIPNVTACAGATMDSLSASWTASDPDSSITLYQYAIGTTPGGSDVINWTFTDQTSFDLSGLTLTPGQLYYISVKARNAGGLWSEAATPEGVLPGSGLCTTNSFLAYLSLVSK
jgi:subtilisin family serine protease